MGDPNLQPRRSELWQLVDRQHGVISRSQLLELGLSPKAIKHRVVAGRLHPVGAGCTRPGDRSSRATAGGWPRC
jgi:Transcriptional regulator, AbiEi antitoxin